MPSNHTFVYGWFVCARVRLRVCVCVYQVQFVACGYYSPA